MKYFTAWLLVLAACTSGETEVVGPLAPARLRSDVEFLASPSMKGRGIGTPEGRKAADWVAERFAALGLKPAVNGSWFHEFEFRGKPCRNVAGLLEVTGATEYVVVGAHHDHLGVRGRRVHPGADDNASGVAGVLALAEILTAHRSELRRHVVVVSYDAEENGLIGSRRFVADDVIPTSETAFMLVFDLIAGNFLPSEKDRFYVLGSEHSRAVRAIVERRRRGRRVEAVVMGTYLIEPVGPAFARSDYAAYRKKRVPYLFFTTATPWYYHTPSDTPERLDYGKMSELLAIARDVLLDVATAERRPDFVKAPAPESGEAEAIVTMLESILAQAGSVRLKDERRATLETMLPGIRELAGAETIDGRGRRTLQKAIVQILQVAKEAKPQ